jgi:hypothetical protein
LIDKGYLIDSLCFCSGISPVRLSFQLKRKGTAVCNRYAKGESTKLKPTQKAIKMLFVLVFGVFG